jgi:hypothetical protein
MKLNSKGEIVYVRYGSPRGYECLHCAKALTPPPNKTIYADPWTWYKDGAGRIRCGQCRNLAERV